MGAEALACCSVHPSQGRDPFTSFPFPLGSGKFPLGGFAPPLLNGVSLRSQQIWERPSDERSSTPLAGQSMLDDLQVALDLFYPSLFARAVRTLRTPARECEFSRLPLEERRRESRLRRPRVLGKRDVGRHATFHGSRMP